MRKIFILSMALLFLAGCAYSRLIVLKEPATIYSNYKYAEIPAFESKVSTPKDFNKTLTERFIEKIRISKLFAEIAPNFSEKKDVLLIRGEIVEFDAGDQLARWFWGGIGDIGAAKITLQFDYIDKETGKTLCQIELAGKVSAGIFGGQISDAHDDIIRKVIKFTSEHFK